MKDIQEIKVSIIILGTLVCFYFYYYFAGNFLLKKIFRDPESEKQQVKIFLFKKLSGLFFLGIIPLLIYSFFTASIYSDFGLGFQAFWKNILTILILSLIVFSFIYLTSKNNGPVKDKPQIEVNNWTLKLFMINSLGWILYLTGYEVLFRGILLLTCYKLFGAWIAISINLAIYSAIHMVNGTGEAIGALIWGFLVCLLTIYFETILIAIVMHIVLALSTDYFAIKFRPDRQFYSKESLKSDV